MKLTNHILRITVFVGVLTTVSIGASGQTKGKKQETPAKSAPATEKQKAQDQKQDQKQDNPAAAPTGGITEEIEVVRPYKPVLADAVKIRRSPDLSDKKAFKPLLNYNILTDKLELNSDLYRLQAKQLAGEQESDLRNNLVKIGAGNLNTGLGELYLNTGRDEALQAGMFFKHLNQEGSLAGQKMSRQEASIYGRSILDAVTLNGQLGYSRLGTNFYGFNPADSAANSSPDKQRYGTISLRGELLKNYADSDSTAFTYAAKANAYFLRDYYSARENSLALSGFLNKTWNQFNFGINTSVDFTGTKDSIKRGNNIFRLNPYVKLQGANYKLILGLNVVNEFGDRSRTNVLPAVSAEVPLASGFATLFGGFTGDVLKTSLLDLSNENPFISSNIGIINPVEKTNIYGGIKGNAGSGFGFKASVFYKTIQNMSFFVNSPGDFRKFDVIYDNGNTKVAGFDGEVSVNASEMFTWTGRLNINNYTPASEAKAWYKPEFRLVSNARLSINKKLTIDGELAVNGESYAKTFAATPDAAVVPVKIKSFVDLSAGAEYRFKEKIGLFLRANNLVGKEYQQYLYYPNFGMNIFGGFNYSF